MNSADFLKIKNNEYFCPNHPDESTGHNEMEYMKLIWPHNKCNGNKSVADLNWLNDTDVVLYEFWDDIEVNICLISMKLWNLAGNIRHMW